MHEDNGLLDENTKLNLESNTEVADNINLEEGQRDPEEIDKIKKKVEEDMKEVSESSGPTSVLPKGIK